MIDFGIDKLALIGAVALIVIGPQRLPRVARTVGVLLGKAQRYVAQVQSEVSRSIELEDLHKMKASVESAAYDVGQSVQHGLDGSHAGSATGDERQADHAPYYSSNHGYHYTPPRKNWRLKKTALPVWYKQRNGVRRHVQSGAARVARFRPHGGSP